MNNELTQQQKDAAQDMFSTIDFGHFEKIETYKRAENSAIYEAKKCKQQDNIFMYEIYKELIRLIRIKKKELTKKLKKTSKNDR